MRPRRPLAARYSEVSAIGAAFALAWAVLAGPTSARGQAAPPAAGGADADGFEPVVDVTTRYRLVEAYSVKPGPSGAGGLGRYKVAIRDTTRRTTDRPQGAPEQVEGTFRAIFDEQAAAIGTDGRVSATIRRYDAVRMAGLPQTKGDARNPFEGLLIWYQVRPVDPPLVLSLTPGRPLREVEYQQVAIGVFMPALIGLLPGLPTRVGDTWRVPQAAAQVLLSERLGRGGELRGRFEEVRRNPTTGARRAIFSIGGRATTDGRGQVPDGDTAINARIVFAIPPVNDPAAAAAAPKDEGQLEVRGGIASIKLGSTTTAPAPDAPAGGGRLRQVDRRELVIERQLDPAGDPLPVPDAAPEPTVDNSWVTFDEPSGRFQFRHPQEMQARQTTGPGDDGVDLIRPRPTGPDQIRLVPRPADQDPELVRKQLDADWRELGLEVIRGPFGPLPEADWPGRRVYRIEASLKPAAGSNIKDLRLHFNAYVIKYTGKATLYAETTTPSDPPLAFRQQAEDVLRTFRYAGTSPMR